MSSKKQKIIILITILYLLTAFVQAFASTPSNDQKSSSSSGAKTLSPVFPAYTEREFFWKEMPQAKKYQYKIMYSSLTVPVKHVQTKATRGFLPKEKSEVGTYIICVTGYDKNNDIIDIYVKYFYLTDQPEIDTGYTDMDSDTITFFPPETKEK